jgi:hypothetical protein
VRTHAAMRVLSSILALPLLPVTLVSTFVLGILATVTFGILLFLLSLVWIVILGALLGVSWFWLKVPPLRLLTAIVGIPVALVAYVMASMVPSMGEHASRASKLLQALTFPYSLQVFQWDIGKLDLSKPEVRECWNAIENEMRGNAMLTWYVQAKLAAPNEVPERI